MRMILTVVALVGVVALFAPRRRRAPKQLVHQMSPETDSARVTMCWRRLTELGEGETVTSDLRRVNCRHCLSEDA